MCRAWRAEPRRGRVSEGWPPSVASISCEPQPDTIPLSAMSKSFAAPRTIRRIAARRVFQSANGTPVVLTLGVPQPVPASNWGCPLQITGLETDWRRPRYVFGIDGLQALHLAMKCATAVLTSAKPELESPVLCALRRAFTFDVMPV